LLNRFIVFVRHEIRIPLSQIVPLVKRIQLASLFEIGERLGVPPNYR
jgi:hypothetical protein